MTIRWRDEDPGLPIAFEQCSNGEYEPEPITPVRRQAEHSARAGIDDAIRRTGIGRREFLRSASALMLAHWAAADWRQTGDPVGDAPGGRPDRDRRLYRPHPGNRSGEVLPLRPPLQTGLRCRQVDHRPLGVRLRRPRPPPRVRPRPLDSGRLVLGQPVPPGALRGGRRPARLLRHQPFPRRDLHPVRHDDDRLVGPADQPRR